MALLTDLIGGSSNIELSATMADGVKTFPYTANRGGSTWQTNANYVTSHSPNAFGGLAKIDTTSPFGRAVYVTICNIGDIAYCYGYQASLFYSYNLLTNVWTALDLTGTTIGSQCEFITDGTDIYCLVWYDTVGAAYVYNRPLKFDTALGTWSELAAPTGTLPTNYRNFVYDGNGVIYNYTYNSNIINVYDIATNAYTQITVLNEESASVSSGSSIIYRNGFIYSMAYNNKQFFKVDVATGTATHIATMADSSFTETMYNTLFLVGDIIYYAPYLNRRFAAYNITTRITQEADIGLINKHYGSGNTVIVRGTKIWFIMPYNTYDNFQTAYSKAVATLDLSVPHFYNIKK